MRSGAVTIFGLLVSENISRRARLPIVAAHARSPDPAPFRRGFRNPAGPSCELLPVRSRMVLGCVSGACAADRETISLAAAFQRRACAALHRRAGRDLAPARTTA